MLENKNLVQLWGNDSKRKEFLEAYKDWGVWLQTPELDLIYYRYELPDGKTIIAMEHKHHSFAGIINGEYQYKWTESVHYFIRKPDEPFTPSSKSSISAVADLLKEAKVSLQKKEAQPWTGILR